MQAAVNKAIRVGRATVLAIGLAVTLALVLGVAATANAAAGDPLKLGKLNAINKITRLVGGADTALLRIDNSSSGAGATAVGLQVEPGKAPVTVNPEAGTATGFSADELDGKDSTAFFPNRTYLNSSDAVTGKGGGAPLVFTGVPCDPGDKILNAGGAANPEDDMIEERPTGSFTWLVRIRDNGTPTVSNVVANCADFPPLR